MSRAVGDMPLAGKIVAVTGGGSGIGLAFVKHSIDQGARGVIIGDLKLTSDASQLVDAHESKDNTPRVVFVRCDVTRWSNLRNLIDQSVKIFDDVPDVYVPSAGVFEPKFSNFWDDEGEDDSEVSPSYKTMRINVDHPIKLTRLAMRALLSRNKKGAVCLLASRAGLTGIYLCALYCASKHAIVGFAKSMAAADALEGVKVICVCPGAVMSPLWTERDDDRMKDFHVDDAATPVLTTKEVADLMGRMVSTKEFAGGSVASIIKRADGVREEVVFKGGEEGVIVDDKGRQYGDIQHTREVLDTERGKGKWAKS